MTAVVCQDGRKIEGILSKDELLKIASNSRQKHMPEHPEARWLLPYCLGLTADIGCGAEKVSPFVVGIDKLAPGEIGVFGCMSGRQTVADISANAGDLSFIADGTFDSVVSRHCFEHLADPMATLREWLRILRVGGNLAMVLPDDRTPGRNFMNVDHDHKFRCYPETVQKALDGLNAENGKVKGRMLDNCRTVVPMGPDGIPNWSFFSLIERA